jgi:hypothetical protein
LEEVGDTLRGLDALLDRGDERDAHPTSRRVPGTPVAREV